MQCSCSLFLAHVMHSFTLFLLLCLLCLLLLFMHGVDMFSTEMKPFLNASFIHFKKEKFHCCYCYMVVEFYVFTCSCAVVNIPFSYRILRFTISCAGMISTIFFVVHGCSLFLQNYFFLQNLRFFIKYKPHTIFHFLIKSLFFGQICRFLILTFCVKFFTFFTLFHTLI